MLPASGGASFNRWATKCIRFAYHGCANRPFFHIVVMEKRRQRQGPVIEQLGTFDPMANVHGEKLCSLNLERISYWIGRHSDISKPCAELFGLAGLLPIYPTTYMTAWRNRRKQAAKEEQEKTEAAETS